MAYPNYPPAPTRDVPWLVPFLAGCLAVPLLVMGFCALAAMLAAQRMSSVPAQRASRQTALVMPPGAAAPTAAQSTGGPEVQLIYRRNMPGYSIGTVVNLTDHPVGPLIIKVDPIPETAFRSGFPVGTRYREVLAGSRSDTGEDLVLPPGGRGPFVIASSYWQIANKVHVFERGRNGDRPLSITTRVEPY